MTWLAWMAAAAGAAAIFKVLTSGRGRFNFGGLSLRWG